MIAAPSRLALSVNLTRHRFVQAALAVSATGFHAPMNAGQIGALPIT